MMESPRNYDIQAAERIFKKVVHPGLNTMRIVDRNGLPLQNPPSQIRPRSFVLSPRGVPTKVPDHSYSGRPTSNRYTDISTGDTPELISPERFGRNSMPGSPDSKPMSRQHSSSHLSKKRAVSTTPVFNRPIPMTKSASSQRYLSGVPSEKRSLQDNRARWNTSSQGIRLDSEWDNLSNCRALKRSSEDEKSAPDRKDKNGIVGHRVDRMYFMSGNSLKLQPRYHVDDEELKQLKEMAKSRQTSHPVRSSRLGRMSIHSSTSRKSQQSNRKQANVTESRKSAKTNQDGDNIKQEDKKLENEKPLGINGLKITTGRKSPLQGWGAGDGEGMSTDRGELIPTESLHNDPIKNGNEVTVEQNENAESRDVISRDMSHDVEPIGTEQTDTDIMFDEFQKNEMKNTIEEEENENGDANDNLDDKFNSNHRPDGRHSGELIENDENVTKNNDEENGEEDFTFVREEDDDDDENKNNDDTNNEDQ